MINKIQNNMDQSREKTSPSRLIQVRSDLHVGANADCSLGIQYWRKQYNYWKQLANSMGCA